MANEIVTATYTGTGITAPDPKTGSFQMVAPIVKVTQVEGEKPSKPTKNSSAKTFTKAMMVGAKAVANADGTISITITEGKRGRKTRNTLTGNDALKALGI